MTGDFLGKVWRRLPRRVLRAGVWLWEPRFAVTAGGVVEDERGRVLLLKHNFRKGSGWGIPGGFLGKSESPEDALRRELREEVGLEVESARLVFARTHRRPQQVEIIFRCRADSSALSASESIEVVRAAWFARGEFPEGLSADQRRLIERALSD
ncbi:MAG TPA: NUDIX domain-containing protein [Pyrinomonadaceae bacterium]|nr:NUDIX domain-containing protein [Pyrinomonadaceae bacterium]